jgi:hypothetical protein
MRNDKQNYACVATNHQIAPPTTNHLIAFGDQVVSGPERSHGGDAGCTKYARNKYIIQTLTFFKKPCYTRENLCLFCKVVEKSKGFFLNKTLGCLK